MEKRLYNQEKELREYFAAIPTDPMPDALKERIMEGVRKAEEEKFSLKSEKWGLIAAIVISTLFLGTVIWGLFHYKLIPDIAFDFSLKIPQVDMQGAGIWLALGATGLLFLMGESLLAQRFIGKRRHSKNSH